jgi:hypothetical protein
LALGVQFGLNFKKERDRGWISETYNNATLPAVTDIEPRMSSETSMAYELEKFINYHESIIANSNYLSLSYLS